ncbi:hypothetical protein ENBRE01_2980 [Enteropsectra breve]|nr:hypothetical protein ENBRE01_2980 [Enteropsectra breve]
MRNSLFNYYLVHGRTPPMGYGITNSLPKKSTRSTSHRRFLTVSYTPEGSSQPLQYPLEILETLDEELLPDWITHFRNIALLLGWTDSIGLAYLRAAISPTLWEYIGSRTTLDNALDSLLAAAFPSTHRSLYDRNLLELSQNDFTYIQQYIIAINSMLYRWQASSKASKSETEKRREETFLRGLSPETRLEMQKLGYEDSKTITEKIKLMEDLIMQISNNKNHKSGSIQEHRTSSPQTQRYDASSHQQTKWCTFHKTPHHSDEECRKQRFKGERSNRSYKHGKPSYNEKEHRTSSHKHSRDTDTAHLIREPTDQPTEIMLLGTVNKSPIKALLDTGARRNYMSSATAKKTQVKISPVDIIKRVELGNGSSVNVIGTAEAEIRLEEFPAFTFKETFSILEGTLEEILLGCPFLNAHEIMIDYREQKLRIVDQVLLLNELKRNSWTENPDSQLTERAMALTQCSLKDQCLEKIAALERKTNQLNAIPGVKMKIKITDTTPISKYPYPVPGKMREAVNNEIKRLTELGVIRKAKCVEYASPAFPISKKDGSIRLVVDYRAINAITVKEGFPFPNVHEELRAIPKSKIFSQIDLKRGYHQMEVDENSRKYTAFVIQANHYEYNRVPFGLANAPRLFQRTMQHIFGHLTFVKIFLDDFLIFSNSENEHAKHLDTVLTIAQQHNLTLSFEKSSFFKDSVKFLGHIISEKGIKPDISRVEGLKQFNSPKTRRQLLQLLGLMNWYRPFIPGLSKTIQPLTTKTSKNIRFTWTEHDQKIADDILIQIKEATLITVPDYQQNFIMDTDASALAIGATLFQKQGVIGIYSKKLTASQQNYSNTERELLAIVEALKYFRTLIYGTKIIVRTDHSNLLYSPELHTSRAQRWKLLLEEYDVDLKYIPGQQNIAADTLSRCMSITENNHNNIEAWIKNAQQTLQDTQQPLFDHKNRRIIPQSSSLELTTQLHNYFSHPGTSQLRATINRFLNIPNLKIISEKLRKECKKCQTNLIGRSNYGKLYGTLQTEQPLIHIATDILGPIQTSEFPGKHSHSKFWILTFTDRCTHWSSLYVIYDITPNSIIKNLNNWIKEHQKPKTILSDQGRQYTSAEFTKFLNENDIEQILCSPYSPTSNGIAERINQSIIFVLKHFKDEGINAAVRKAQDRLRFCFNRTIKCTPVELVKGTHPLSNQLTLNSSETLQHAILNSKITSQKNQTSANSHRNCKFTFKSNTQVYRRSRETGKLAPLWDGPYTVSRCKENSNTLLLDNGKRIIRTNIRSVRPCQEGDNVVTL